MFPFDTSVDLYVRITVIALKPEILSGIGPTEVSILVDARMHGSVMTDFSGQDFCGNQSLWEVWIHHIPFLWKIRYLLISTKICGASDDRCSDEHLKDHRNLCLAA